jgi:hypothetical protein
MFAAREVSPLRATSKLKFFCARCGINPPTTNRRMILEQARFVLREQTGTPKDLERKRGSICTDFTPKAKSAFVLLSRCRRQLREFFCTLRN